MRRGSSLPPPLLALLTACALLLSAGPGSGSAAPESLVDLAGSVPPAVTSGSARPSRPAAPAEVEATVDLTVVLTPRDEAELATRALAARANRAPDFLSAAEFV